MKKIFPFLLLFVFISSLSFAQNIPAGQEPGAEAERFRKEAEQKKASLQKKAKAPQVQVEEKAAPLVPEGVSFVLKDIKITGTTLFKPEDFRSAYASYIGKTVTYKDLNDIADKIKSKYKEKGYLTTSAYMPEQEIKEGIVEIRVIEGKLGKVKIEGNKFSSASFLEKYIHTKKNEIINVIKLERDILRLNQSSDLTVKATLAQGEAPETSDLILSVTEKTPYHAAASFDNQGTRLTGKYRESGILWTSNLTGNLDSLFINTIYSGGSIGESDSYSLPIDTYGTKFGMDYTYFRTALGREFKSYKIIGETNIYSPHITVELALQEDFQAYANFGIDMKSTIKKVLDVKVSDDQMRDPYFGFDFTKTDDSGQTSFSPKFVFGTANFLGSSTRGNPMAGRANSDGEFFIYQQSLNRLQRMIFDSYLSIRSQAQVASRTLPSSEQLQLGGFNSIRGYPEGDYLCDNGAYANFDWVMPMYIFPKDLKLPGADTPLRHQIEPVLFADIGGGGLQRTHTGELNRKFLAGLGGGVKLHFNNKISISLEWAKDVGDKPTQGSGPSTFYITCQGNI